MLLRTNISLEINLKATKVKNVLLRNNYKLCIKAICSLQIVLVELGFNNNKNKHYLKLYLHVIEQ